MITTLVLGGAVMALNAYEHPDTGALGLLLFLILAQVIALRDDRRSR